MCAMSMATGLRYVSYFFFCACRWRTKIYPSTILTLMLRQYRYSATLHRRANIDFFVAKKLIMMPIRCQPTLILHSCPITNSLIFSLKFEIHSWISEQNRDI